MFCKIHMELVLTVENSTFQEVAIQGAFFCEQLSVSQVYGALKLKLSKVKGRE